MRTLFYNGRIYTMRRPYETVENVLIEDGKIIGTDVEVSDAYEMFDLEGKTMLPALTDVHMHLVMLGKMLKSLVLYEDTDINEVKRKISAYESGNERDTILGYDENNFPDQYRMTMKELDLLTDKPTLVMRVCQHAGFANTEAFQSAGIDDNVEDPPGGYFERDASGRLTGWAYDSAMELLRNRQVNDDEVSVGDDITTAVNYLHSLGIANAHTEDMSSYGPFEVPLNAYLNTLGPDKLKFRVNLLRHEQVYEEMVKKDIQYQPDWVEEDAMKIFSDGAFGGKTALLREPYEGSEDTGLQIHSREQLEARVKLARENNDAVAVHIIGDKALEIVLDAIEKYPVTAGKHDRLIHVSLVNPDLLKRMAELDVVCDVQPTFLTSDMPWVESYIGKERADYLYLFKTFRDKGLCIGGSSDAPIEEVNPLLGIHTLVTRRGKTGVYNEKEILDRHSAFEMYTTEAAKIVYREDRAGMIKESYFADFAVFDKNVMEIEADELLSTAVEYTIIDGDTVYQNSH